MTTFSYHGAAVTEIDRQTFSNPGQGERELISGSLTATPTNQLWMTSYFNDAAEYAWRRSEGLEASEGETKLRIYRLDRDRTKNLDDLAERWRADKNFDNYTPEETSYLKFVEELGGLPERSNGNTKRSIWEIYDIEDGTSIEFLEIPYNGDRKEVIGLFKESNDSDLWIPLE